MKKLIALALFVGLISLKADAQSTAHQIYLGSLASSGCSGAFSTCFKPYSPANPMPVALSIVP